MRVSQVCSTEFLASKRAQQEVPDPLPAYVHPRVFGMSATAAGTCCPLFYSLTALSTMKEIQETSYKQKNAGGRAEGGASSGAHVVALLLRPSQPRLVFELPLLAHHSTYVVYAPFMLWLTAAAGLQERQRDAGELGVARRGGCSCAGGGRGRHRPVAVAIVVGQVLLLCGQPVVASGLPVVKHLRGVSWSKVSVVQELSWFEGRRSVRLVVV